MTAADSRRHVPRTDRLLAQPLLAAPIERLGIAQVKRTVAEVQQSIRDGLLPPEQALTQVLHRLPASATTLTPVLNATGVVLHTNLGRAPLSPAARAAIAVAAGYVDVEFDVRSGARAPRGRGARAALAEAVAEAQDLLILNNGAAALVLATTALGAGREVIVSRGELVEIGDGFRLPELIESTGARIREVGTTNRTTVADYAGALGANTGCILKVHPSNFVVSGYTSSVSVAELADLKAPVVVDVGSGLLRPDRLLCSEPDVASALAAGANVVTCSADKLLGGPQAGLAFGTAAEIALMRGNPLARALRVDKITIAAIEATIRGPLPPTARYLGADAEQLRVRCERLVSQIGGEVLPSSGAVGGGCAPGVELPGWAVALAEHYAEDLRMTTPAVIGRLEHGRCLLDLRCIDESDEPALIAAVQSVTRSSGP